MHNWTFNKALQARGYSQKRLAIELGMKTSHLSSVINGQRGSAATRRKLFHHLTPEEIQHLGWTAEYTAWKTGHRPDPCSTRNKFTNSHHASPPAKPINLEQFEAEFLAGMSTPIQLTLNISTIAYLAYAAQFVTQNAAAGRAGCALLDTFAIDTISSRRLPAEMHALLVSRQPA